MIAGSFFVSVLSFLCIFFINLFIKRVDIIFFVLISLFIGASTYFIFYLFTKYFINDRLKLIYRSIRKGKMTKDNTFSFKLSDDIIADTEKEVKQWSDERTNEISKLKVQEEFRREFLGNLAHELKTPVFSIQGYILTLLDGAIDDEGVNRVFLERASKATERITNILEDLDQITRLEVDDLQMEMRPFDLYELVQEVFDSLEIIAKEKAIQLLFAKDYGLVFVVGDRSKIAQVLTNLINNSIAYGNEGGKTIARFYNVDELVTIEISDNGPGIEEKHFPRLFERFYRVEKSRNRNEGGSGLGLAIVKHIIESHGQSISVRSTVGVGSTFSFTLDAIKPGSNTIFSSRGLPIK